MACPVLLSGALGNSNDNGLEDVIACKNCTAVIEINPPAPNAMGKKGYDRYYDRISATINGHVYK